MEAPVRQAGPAEQQPPAAGEQLLQLRGVRVHNLKNIDLDLPLGSLIVITGPSGSGKSSLAFDTIYAEGHRQYVESLSAYARQYLQQLERPEVDSITGLPPTVAIDQRALSTNPRSTVATVTEIHDYLRLLFARAAEMVCPGCGEPIGQQSPEEIVRELAQLPERTRVMLLAPLVRGRRGQHREVLEQLRKKGLVRVRIDGEIYELDSPPQLVPQRRHDIEAVVDRLVIAPGKKERLAESIHLALELGQGLLLALVQTPSDRRKDRWHERLYSTLFACPGCGQSFGRMDPHHFSFNSPYGACPECSGTGTHEAFDPELVIQWDRSFSTGAVLPWEHLSRVALDKLRRRLAPFCRSAGIRWNTPLERLSPAQRKRLLYGDGGKFPGLLELLEQQYLHAQGTELEHHLALYRTPVACPACGGGRLRPESRAARVGGKSIDQVCALSIEEALAFFRQVSFPGRKEPVARRIVPHVLHRLVFLEKVGLGYLTLDRPLASLSGGEAQRVRLAAGIGTGLVGVCYVLDEPTIGLHPRDNLRLIQSLRQLQSLDNTILVVEHDETVIRQADWVVDLGPGAGQHGGQVVAQGPPDEIAACRESLTGAYLRGEKQIPVPRQRRKARLRQHLTLEGVRTHNLKNITVRFPLGCLICVTGVSGSGKSSLLLETLAPALRRELYGTRVRPGPYRRLRGLEWIDKFVQVDQSPIGRTPRSNPATYTGVFDHIRRVFASTPQARLRGYTVARFSFNVAEGRCPHCQGQGVQRIEMNFLPDILVSCPVCRGRRFNQQTLQVRYRGHTIADVLDMTVEEALEFFSEFPIITRQLQALEKVGLGYLHLGQPSATLSGGEAQRVKLATELGKTATGNTLYLLDEPTTGLHLDDVARLLGVLEELVDRGNTVVVIEHHLDVVKRADWVIDLGPEGGQEGGHLVAEGTPEQVATCPESHTGQALRPLLDQAE